MDSYWRIYMLAALASAGGCDAAHGGSKQLLGESTTTGATGGGNAGKSAFDAGPDRAGSAGSAGDGEARQMLARNSDAGATTAADTGAAGADQVGSSAAGTAPASAGQGGSSAAGAAPASAGQGGWGQLSTPPTPTVSDTIESIGFDAHMDTSVLSTPFQTPCFYIRADLPA